DTATIVVRRSLGREPRDKVEFILDGPGARDVPAATTPTRGRRLTDRKSDKGDVHLTRVTFGHLRRNAVRHPFAGRVMHLQGAPDTKMAPVGEPRPDRQDQRRSFLRSPRKFPQADAANSR